MLAARDIRLARGGRPVLAGASLRVTPGGLVAVIGPNGAGKSSLLQVLSRALTPDTGEVTLDDRPLSDWHRGALARRRAVLPQAPNVVFPFRARDVVALGRNPHAGLCDRATDRGVVEAEAEAERAAQEEALAAEEEAEGMPEAGEELTDPRPMDETEVAMEPEEVEEMAETEAAQAAEERTQAGFDGNAGAAAEGVIPRTPQNIARLGEVDADALRQRRLDRGDGGLDAALDVDGVAPRRALDADRQRGVVADEVGVQPVRPQHADRRDVAHAQLAAVGIGPQHDVGDGLGAPRRGAGAHPGAARCACGVGAGRPGDGIGDLAHRDVVPDK